jgi:signal transduction histidine kinase
MESWRLVYPSDRSKVEEYSQRRLEGMEMISSYEARGVTKDRRVIWVVRNNTRIMHRGEPAILGNLVDITLRKRIEATLQKSENELRMLSSRLLTVQENERKRIALELHDTIAQNLVTIKFTLAQKLKQMSGDSPPPGITIESVMELVQANITEIRRIMTDLRPSLLDDLGIIATISWHCREFQTIYSHIQIKKEVAVTEEDIPDDLKIVIFRILQEAMNNIVKHSGADKLTLSLLRKNGKLELTVRDYGKGFDYRETLSHVTDKRGLGLVGMRERAELSFGTFSIDSKIGEGTKICVSWQVK